MKSSYGLDTRDPSALKVYLSVDLPAVFLAELAIPPGDIKTPLALYAPLLLLVLNLVVGAVVFRDSYRKSVTLLLAAWLGVFIGVAAGILFFQSGGASTPTNRDSDHVHTVMLASWLVPFSVMIVCYLKMLRDRGE
jgi:hypothetical protein